MGYEEKLETVSAEDLSAILQYLTPEKMKEGMERDAQKIQDYMNGIMKGIGRFSEYDRPYIVASLEKVEETFRREMSHLDEELAECLEEAFPMRCITRNVETGEIQEIKEGKKKRTEKTYKMKLNINSLMDETPLGKEIKTIARNSARGEIMGVDLENLVKMVFWQFYEKHIEIRPDLKNPGGWKIVDIDTGETMYRGE